jgi:pilus assembly protein Flp/PilA
MKSAKSYLRSLVRDESGQDLIEYGLLTGILALGAVATIGTLGSGVSSVYSKVSSSLTSAM